MGGVEEDGAVAEEEGAVVDGRAAVELVEEPREVVAVGVAALGGDFGDGEGGVGEEAARDGHAAVLDVALRGAVEALVEESAELWDADAGDACESGEAEGVVEVLVEVPEGACERGVFVAALAFALLVELEGLEEWWEVDGAEVMLSVAVHVAELVEESAEDGCAGDVDESWGGVEEGMRVEEDDEGVEGGVGEWALVVLGLRWDDEDVSGGDGPGDVSDGDDAGAAGDEDELGAGVGVEDDVGVGLAGPALGEDGALGCAGRFHADCSPDGWW